MAVTDRGVLSQTPRELSHPPRCRGTRVPGWPDTPTLAGTCQFSSSGLLRLGARWLRGEAAGRVSATVSLLPAAPACVQSDTAPPAAACASTSGPAAASRHGQISATADGLTDGLRCFSGL